MAGRCPLPAAASERLYQALLRLYPQRHRQEYGPLMAQAFRDLCRAAHRRGGLLAIIGLCARTLLDAVTTAAAERVTEARSHGELDMSVPLTTRRIRQAAMALVLLSLFAPWYQFWDGGTFSGWLMLLSGIICAFGPNGSIYLLWLNLMVACLAAAALISLGPTPLSRRAGRWQPLFLLSALMCPLAYTWPRSPAVLWGVWFTAACIAIAILLEVAMLTGLVSPQEAV